MFAGVALNRAKPNVRAERVPGHPDTFDLWNEGPGCAVIVHADVSFPSFPRGASIDDARSAIPGLWVDERIVRDHGSGERAPPSNLCADSRSGFGCDEPANRLPGGWRARHGGHGAIVVEGGH